MSSTTVMYRRITIIYPHHHYRHHNVLYRRTDYVYSVADCLEANHQKHITAQRSFWHIGKCPALALSARVSLCRCPLLALSWLSSEVPNPKPKPSHPKQNSKNRQPQTLNHREPTTPPTQTLDSLWFIPKFFASKRGD